MPVKQQSSTSDFDIVSIGGEKFENVPTEAISPSYNRLMDQNRTFFCSELVAKAFKVLGVIENDSRSCTTFYPKHFAE